MTRLAFAAMMLSLVACTRPGIALADKSDFPEYDLEKFTTTESGLKYRIIKPGGENKPTATSTVDAHYHGTFPSGEKFDSSYDRGASAQFPLNRVIGGWTEGLQLIGKGGQIQLVCPPELAYGPGGRPGIPPNATLYFNVELVDFK